MNYLDVDMVEEFLFYSIFIVTGIAIDWAFYWRFTNMLGIFREIPSKFTYSNYAFPRLLFLSIFTLMVAWGSRTDKVDYILIIFGGGGFLIVTMYPHVSIFLKSNRIK